MTHYTEYSLASYGDMLMDSVRMPAYLEAMRRYITPDTVVLDLGTGPGVTALLAARCGARHVYAVEGNATVWLGQRLAVANGLQDRITFFRGLSTVYEIPERADLLISDLRGNSPLYGSHVPTIIDARTRLLKDGAIQLPGRDRLLVGLARDDQQCRRLRYPWRFNDFELDLSLCYPHVINQILVASPKSTLSYGSGKVWHELNYLNIESPNARGDVVFMVEQAMLVNGLELWFETELAPGICYSTAPTEPLQVYGRKFLPLTEDLDLQIGDQVAVWLDYRFLDETYRISWRVVVSDQKGVVRAELKQSTFFAAILNPKIIASAGHPGPPKKVANA